MPRKRFSYIVNPRWAVRCISDSRSSISATDFSTVAVCVAAILQCVAACCSAVHLRFASFDIGDGFQHCCGACCTAFCSVLQRVAVRCISDSRPSISATDFGTVVKCVAVCVVVYVAVCCSVLMQCSGSQIRVFGYRRRISALLRCVLQRLMQRIAACCSVLDLRFALFISAMNFSTVAACVAACCRVLQCDRSQIRVV